MSLSFERSSSKARDLHIVGVCFAVSILAGLNVLLDISFIASELCSAHSRFIHLGLPELLVLTICHSIELVGAISLLRVGTKPVVFLGFILCCIPIISPFFCLGIPLGIWTLSVIRYSRHRCSGCDFVKE
jgi:hypothetical protein